MIDALAVDARRASLLLLAVDDVGDLRQVDGTAARCATMIWPKCAGSLILPSMRTSCSLAPARWRPAGTSMLALRIAFTTSSTPTPSAVSARA